MVQEAQARAQSAQNFVDLYELLHLSPDADSETLRKHINKSYLEAQQNLDHRNAHKRLQFQQMFEIYLPQARHLLLDPARRAEYDRYLKSYRSGSTLEPAPADAPQPRPPRAPQQSSTQSAGSLPSMTPEQQIDHEKLAAEREALWARWKNGLESLQEEEKAAEEAAKAAQAAAREAARHAPRNSSQESKNGSGLAGGVPSLDATGTVTYTGPERRQKEEPARAAATERRAASGAVAGRSWSVGNTAEVEKRQQEIEAEREREKRRLELSHQKAKTAGLTWGVGGGVAFFVVGYFVLSMLLSMLSSAPVDLIQNGDFSRQFNEWGRPSDRSQLVPASAGPYKLAMRIPVQPRYNSNPWDISLRQHITAPVGQGDTITMRFWARSEDSLPFAAAVTEDNSDHHKPIFKEMTLTPQWREYTFTGRARTDYAAKAAYLEFFMSYKPGTYEFAGLRLTTGSSPVPGVLFGVPINLIIAALLALLAIPVGRALAARGREQALASAPLRVEPTKP